MMDFEDNSAVVSPEPGYVYSVCIECHRSFMNSRAVGLHFNATHVNWR